ncbi:MAG: RHS repeat-associated core domain-containing protein, partial [Treponema sp.]|nr:RHS repeat-associated core domain-containing protein [Treponema sp.]
MGNVQGYNNNAYDYQTRQDYEYDDLYQLTGVTGQSRGSLGTYSGLPQLYLNEYTQTFSFNSIGNMTKKTSRSRDPADDLTYQYDYDYYAGTHKASRIGNWYYNYDGNGNLVTENYGSPVTVNTGTAQVYEEDGVYSTDYGFAYTERTGSQGSTTIERREYQWNERNLLRRSVNKNYQAEYRYGSDGQRALKYSVAGTSRTET